MAERDRPHLFLGHPLRCCLKCNGQTKVPYPAPLIHESTCRKAPKKWGSPA